MMEVIALRGAGVDLEDDLGEEAGEFDLDDGADDLVAAAGGAEALARGGGGARRRGGEVAGEGGLGDAVVAAGGLDGAELAGEDPLLDGGLADAGWRGGFAWVRSGAEFHFRVSPRVGEYSGSGFEVWCRIIV